MAISGAFTSFMLVFRMLSLVYMVDKGVINMSEKLGLKLPNLLPSKLLLRVLLTLYSLVKPFFVFYVLSS